MGLANVFGGLSRMLVGDPRLRELEDTLLEQALREMRTRNAGKGLPKDQTTGAVRDEIARRNAMLPRAMGGLDMGPENTAMDRASRMFPGEGYHGSLYNIDQFDASRFGQGFAGPGVYITDSPYDASINYASIFGPDVQHKIGHAFDARDKDWQHLQRFMDLGDIQRSMSGDYPTFKPWRQEQIAKGALGADNAGVVYPVRYNASRPVDLTDNGLDTLLEPPLVSGPTPDSAWVEGPTANAYAQGMANMSDLGADLGDVASAFDSRGVFQVDELTPAANAYRAMRYFAERNGPFYTPDDEFMTGGGVAQEFLKPFGIDSIQHEPNFGAGGTLNFGRQHSIMFNPEQVRSRHAAFDPLRRHEPDLLANVAPAAVAAGAGAAALGSSNDAEAGIGLDRLTAMARPVGEVRQALGNPVLSEHVYPMAELILDMQKKAATAGVDPRDLLKSYGITTASIQRQGRNAELFPPELRGAETGVLRPEDAAANFFLSQPGQDYLDSAVQGMADPAAVQFIRDAFRSYGRNENLGDLMAAAPQTVLPDLPVIQQMITGGMSPEEILAYFSSAKHFPGVGVAKAGFALPMLGRGDLPVLDARQANVHWGAGGSGAVEALKTKDKAQAVKILADRQKEMAYEMPKRYEPVRQYATHHDVWDRSAGTQTSHGPIIEAMRYGAAAPAAVGLAGLASPGDTRAATLDRDMTHRPFEVPAVAGTVSDLFRDMLFDPAGYMGFAEPTILGDATMDTRVGGLGWAR
jgi:hypothetical protein